MISTGSSKEMLEILAEIVWFVEFITMRSKISFSNEGFIKINVEDIAYVQYLKIPSRGGGLISNPGLS